MGSPFHRGSCKSEHTTKVKNFLAANQDLWGNRRALIKKGMAEGIWKQSSNYGLIDISVEKLLWEDKQDGNIRSIVAKPTTSDRSLPHT